jgi:hypothetical protein
LINNVTPPNNPTSTTASTTIKEENEVEDVEMDVEKEVEKEKEMKEVSGYQLLMDFIERCLPHSTTSNTTSGTAPGSASASATGDSDSSSVSVDWRKLQAAPTPTLLNTLRFHDLVFGRDLGSGAFSVVRYARHIVREKSRDEWPEYAVKVISAAKMNEHGYHASGRICNCC